MMIERISFKIVNWLLKNGAISENDTRFYQYAAFNIIYASTPLISILVIGSCLHVFGESILFAITFLCLRKYTGGFHFNSLMLCIPFSLTIEGLFLILAASKASIILIWFSYPLAVLSLILFSPVMSSKRFLTTEERKHCKLVVIKQLVIISIICYAFDWMKSSDWTAFPKSATIMVGISQYPALLIDTIRRKRNK